MQFFSPFDRLELLRIRLLTAIISLFLLSCGCGGGASSSVPSAPPPPPPPAFQPRPFPGDYFMRLPSQGAGSFGPSVAYTPTLKEMFVSNPEVNGVDAYSTVDGHWVGEISVPGPAYVSFTPDYSSLVIGTITPRVYFANPTTLHLTSEIVVPSSTLVTDSRGDTEMPVMPFPMADGTVFLGMGVTPQSSSFTTSAIHLLLYNPVTESFTSVDPTPTGLTANPARSLDGEFLLVSSTQLYLYSVAAQGYTAVNTSQNISSLAANADGSQFVWLSQILPGTTSSQITFLDRNLQPQSQYTMTDAISNYAVSNFVFSRDGKLLYTWTQNGDLLALNTQTATPAGYFGISVGSLPYAGTLFDVDDNNNVFGAISPGGALIVNASQLQPLPPARQALFIGPSTEANPNVGPIAGGTQVQFIPSPMGSGSDDGIASSTEAYFGASPATQDVVAAYPASSNGENFLTATTPPAKNPGAVSVLLTDANSNIVFLPDAYTYGPHLLRVQPNAVSAQGSDSVTIVAYGLGFDVNEIAVTIAGSPVDMKTATLLSYGNYYPEQSVTIPVPPGTPGWADITLTTPNGSDTMKRGLQYLKQDTNITGGLFAFAVYDPVRSRFYLTGNGNSVAVFDPGSQSFLQPLQSTSISAGAVLQSEALTPDGSKLLVADPADHSVVIFDLVAGTDSTVNVLLSSDFATSLYGPMTIAAAANNVAFVSLTPCITNPVREINLTNQTVKARPDAASTCGVAPYPQFGGSSGDGSVVVFAGNSGNVPPGAESIWSYSAASDAFTFTSVQDTPWVGGKATANADGSVLALSGGTIDQNLAPLAPFNVGGLDSRLNSSGSLIYSVYNVIAISETKNGHDLLTIKLPATAGNTLGLFRPLAIDPTGEKILVATQAGVSYFDLGVVPLAVGAITPNETSPGASVLISGSGFVSGTIVTIGGQNAVCTETDSQTLSCIVPSLQLGLASMTLSNPDGQVFSFEAALTVQ